MFAYIIGSQNPVVGKAYAYEISSSSLSIFGDNTKYEWYLFKKQKNGNWRDVTGTPKVGRSVTYTFHEPVLGNEFELRVFETKSESFTETAPAKKQIAKLDLVPSSSKTAQIDKVILLNRGSKDVNKASYRDTLVAQAFCTAMFDQEVEFQLWEDDAAEGGHNPAINKNNRNPRIYKARVNEKGIAETKIPLLSDERILKQIANKYLMKGDKSEGKNHEYYVTASYHGKIQRANQVNVDVANPDYKKEQPKQQTPSIPKRQDPKKATSQPQKAQPKQNTPKFPATKSSSAQKQTDSQGRIADAYFVNSAGQRLIKAVVGDWVQVRIHTSNMIGKHVQYVVWEYDPLSPDEVSRSGRLEVKEDTITTGGFKITPDIFKEGADVGDSEKQNYFIEVLPLDVSAYSKRFGVSSDGLMEVEKTKSAAVVKGNKGLSTANCGEKYCLKKGDKSDLIREINIRLAGFGGNVPTDEFTDRTEKMIKQFQRDYMKVPETGKVCGNVLKAIDEFQYKYSIDFAEIKCKCGVCTGFGDNSNKGKYLKGNAEAHHRYEYPGVHRSLIWALRAVKFYLVFDGKYQFNKINSGYRCRFHEEYKKKPTTNHMGKALDIHFNKNGVRTKSTDDMEKIRLNIYNKYLGAKWDWTEKNIFNLESTDVGAKTWVHYDVREFDIKYLEDKFFVKNNAELNGKSILSLALELGFKNTCSCIGGGLAKSKEKDTTKKDNKYKWAHSEFGNLIAKKESSDDYNKCNKTVKVPYKVKGKTKYKRKVKEVNDVKVIELTIKEIQEKQSDKSLFAVGRYQLIPNTLGSAIKSLKLDVNKKLDQEMQDKIFDEFLIKTARPKIIGFLEGNGTVEDAMHSSAQEWASIGVEKGKRISDIKSKTGEKIIRYAKGGESYYSGDGLNNAHITPEQIKNALINSKNANK